MANFKHLFFSKFVCDEFAMSNLVTHIVKLMAPTKIIKSIIFFVSVKVTTFIAFWTRTYKCKKNKFVDKVRLSTIFVSNGKMVIAPSVFTGLENYWLFIAITSYMPRVTGFVLRVIGYLFPDIHVTLLNKTCRRNMVDLRQSPYPQQACIL